jgi:UDP-N-acetylmuramate dehydrogenase
MQEVTSNEQGVGLLAKEWRERMVEELQLKEYTFDLPMSKITSFRVGGPADLAVEAATPGELAAVIEYCRREGIPWLLVGRGTNLLVRDGGIRGVVIRLGQAFQEVKVWEDKILAGAAVSLSRVAEAAAAAGLSGLEFASGIPGSVGGAVFMNAGAYGGEIGPLITRVSLYRPGAGFCHRTREELAFAYRRSRLQEGEEILLDAEFLLVPGEEAEIRAKMAELNRRRKEKQPLEFPSAGSVFKRPPGAFAARLIEEAGLKGARIGDAQVAEKHAGFIINRGQATAREILALIDRVKEEVYQKTGILLEPEVRVVGEDKEE